MKSEGKKIVTFERILFKFNVSHRRVIHTLLELSNNN